MNINDEVRIMRKQGFGANYRVGEDGWSRVTFTVLATRYTENGTFYTLSDQTKEYMRHELQKTTTSKEASLDTRTAAVRRLQGTFPTVDPAPFLRLRRMRPGQV